MAVIRQLSPTAISASQPPASVATSRLRRTAAACARYHHCAADPPQPAGSAHYPAPENERDGALLPGMRSWRGASEGTVAIPKAVSFCQATVTGDRGLIEIRIETLKS